VGVRAIFLGTPEFALPTLEAMLAGGVEIAAVITQPDRPAGRGQQPAASPVKRLALERGLAVYQPLKIKAPEAVEYVAAAAPDVIVVVGYGQIIPAAIFERPRLGTINVHASLLPRYRGAAPIQWAIANGETVTGVTTMRIEAGLDTGDILMQREVAIGAEETAPELSARLATVGAALLVETLEALERGAILPRKQEPTQATYAPMLKKEDGAVDWTMTAAQIASRVRGFDPWPGVYSGFRGRLLHLRRVRVLGGPPAAQPGQLVVEGRTLRAACGQGWLELVELQPEGKRRMTAQEFINGHRPTVDDILQ
jgi:methionyl-tRNA formyltransferase